MIQTFAKNTFLKSWKEKTNRYKIIVQVRSLKMTFEFHAKYVQKWSQTEKLLQISSKLPSEAELAVISRA